MGEWMLSQNHSNFRIPHRSTIVHMWRVSFGFIWLKCSRRNHVTSHVECPKNGACHNSWFGFWSYIIYLEYIIVFDVVCICLFLSVTLYLSLSLPRIISAVEQYSFFVLGHVILSVNLIRARHCSWDKINTKVLELQQSRRLFAEALFLGNNFGIMLLLTVLHCNLINQPKNSTHFSANSTFIYFSIADSSLFLLSF